MVYIQTIILIAIRIYYITKSIYFSIEFLLRNLTSKGGDNLIIDFDEQKFKHEIKSIAKNYGASSSQAKMVVSAALSAVSKASKPVNQ